MTVCMTALESAEERRLFEDVYRACCGRMLALARRRLSAQADAEDAVQQSFLALAERFSRLAKLPETQLEAYLVVTVERKCIDILRQPLRGDAVPVHVQQRRRQDKKKIDQQLHGEKQVEIKNPDADPLPLRLLPFHSIILSVPL